MDNGKSTIKCKQTKKEEAKKPTKICCRKSTYTEMRTE
jgi:hypothetical protein